MIEVKTDVPKHPKKSNTADGYFIGIIIGIFVCLSFIMMCTASDTFIRGTIVDRSEISVAQKHCDPHGGLLKIKTNLFAISPDNNKITCLDNSTILYKDIKK